MQQITDKLYIGDVQDALANSNSTDLDLITYLGQEIPKKLCFNCIPTCVHIPLVDGKNEPQKIKSIITIVQLALNSGNKVLIACRAGISRSVVITTAVFALQNNLDFDEAYKQVFKLYPQSFPEQNLFQQVKKVVEDLKCFS